MRCRGELGISIVDVMAVTVGTADPQAATGKITCPVSAAGMGGLSKRSGSPILWNRMARIAPSAFASARVADRATIQILSRPHLILVKFRYRGCARFW